MNRRTHLVLFVFAAANALFAQKYPVSFSQPVKVGQRFQVTGSGSQLRQASAGGRVLSTMEYQVVFHGHAEVVEVDTDGEPVKMTFVVERFTKTQDGVTSDLLSPGSIIIADGTVKQKVFLKDGTMEEPVREAFRLVYSPHDPKEPHDDEIFGTTEPQGIGDSWPINVMLASESLKQTGITIPDGHMSGTVSLLAKDSISGIDCLNLLGKIKGDGVESKDLPPGAVGSMEATFRGCFPLNHSEVTYSEGADFLIQLQLPGPKGTPAEGLTMEFKMGQKNDVIWLAEGLI